MKKCSRCKEIKGFSEFRPNKSQKDGLQKCCISCDKKYQKEWYEKRKEIVKAKSIISNKKSRDRNQKFIIDYLNSNPCIICGESDIVVLEFDHLFNKTIEVSRLVATSSLEKIKEEVTKCQVLCANCHKRKTAKQQNWYKK
jgi:hypothetical protein